jgi:hypothetical protein
MAQSSHMKKMGHFYFSMMEVKKSSGSPNEKYLLTQMSVHSIEKQEKSGK